MDFNSFNKSTFKKIEWSKNTENFTFKKLGDFFANNIKTVQVFGFFFIKSENYGLQPIAIGNDCLINLPTHKKDVISNMLKNDETVKEINDGKCSLSIRQYKSKFGKICYDIDFINTPTTQVEPQATEKTEFEKDIF